MSSPATYTVSGVLNPHMRDKTAEKFLNYQAGMSTYAASDAIKGAAPFQITLQTPSKLMGWPCQKLGYAISHEAEAARLFTRVERNADSYIVPNPLDVLSPSPKPNVFLPDPIPSPTKDESPMPVEPIAPVPSPVTPSVGEAVATALGLKGLIEGYVSSAINTDVPAAIARALEGRITVSHEIKRPDSTTVTLDEHLHPIFGDVLDMVSVGLNVMLKGPAGCGKTTLASQIARAMGVPFGTISCSGGMTESALTGRLLPTGDNGKFEYHESDFVRHYKQASVFLFDELDAADPNVLMVVNSALANGGIHIESRTASGLDTYVPRHAETAIMAACNTFGLGADSMYVGRNPIDAATLDRFVVLEMDYDRAFEKTLVTDAEILNWIWNVRDRATTSRLKRIVSTRMIQKAAGMSRAGWSLAKSKKVLLNGWKQDELNAIGEG